MRPKICVPIVETERRDIIARAREYAALPIQMAEWRVDFYAGGEEGILGIAADIKEALKDKELIVTLRTAAEGGEENGSRFGYFSLIERLLQQGKADYIDVETVRSPEWLRKICSFCADGGTKIIGSYHDFDKTPPKEKIVEQLRMTKEAGCAVAKFACMPHSREDVDTLLDATAAMKETAPDYPLITMSMGELGADSRLYGGLFGSEVSFGSAGQCSAPGQIPYAQMIDTYDKVYGGNSHIILIGFMGVGKSTISRELAERTGRSEIDTDRWIEQREGRTIPEIFDQEGEGYFRRLETELIDELGGMRPAIISCGGGMVLRDLNIKKLQRMGRVVWLTAEPESIYERVKHSGSRPLLNGNMNTEYIRQMMEQRRPRYERAAAVEVSTDHKMISDIAKEILEKCF